MQGNKSKRINYSLINYTIRLYLLKVIETLASALINLLQLFTIIKCN